MLYEVITHLLFLVFTEDSRGLQHENEDENDEGEGVLIIAGNVARAEALGPTQDKASENGASYNFV